MWKVSRRRHKVAFYLETFLRHHPPDTKPKPIRLEPDLNLTSVLHTTYSNTPHRNKHPLVMMESLTLPNSLLAREEPQNQLASMERFPFFDSLLPCEEPREHTNLGSLEKLPLEIRDTIYDLCYQPKDYHIRLRHEKNPGSVRFGINASLSHCRLISKTFSREYEARAPANTLLILGKFRGGYNFQLGDGASKHIQDPQTFPTPGNYTNTVAQYGDLKVTPFDVAGLRCEIPSPPQVLVNRMPTTPAGTFGLDLRLYQDPRSDFLGFRRVFSDLSTDFTPGHTRLGPGALPLHDLNFVLEGDWDSQYNRYDLPVVGTWTPKGGLAFNKVADGTLLRHSVSDEDTRVERHDARL
jgi:hypothetical protein